jgi:hypothetical protein
MNKKIAALLCSALLTTFGTTSVFAQGSPPWVIVPVDMWVCDLNDGRDMDDLDDWIEKFNEWADDQENNDYAAWTLTPSYWGPNQDFDYIWLGAWMNANAMGAGWDLWNSTNDGLMAEYASIATCRVHSNFASAAYRLPEGMDNSGNGVITISDCKRHHGVPGSAIDAAARQWVDTLDESGSNAALYHWYPVFGGGGGPGGGPDLDYKQVTSYQNYSDLGADYERMGNGGLFRRNQELFDHLVACDAARVYDAQSRRFINVRQN